MKSISVLAAALIALCACAPAVPAPQADTAQLTPWHTATANAPAPTAASEKPAATAAPAPTPAPIIHTVALGESISTIALRYGLDTSTVLAANPDINPNAMTVGMQVVVPAGSPQAQIGVISEPLALTLGQPDCSRTLDGGLWCFAMVSNPLDEAAALMAITFTLSGSNPDSSKSMTVPALLDYLPAAESLPAAAFFSAPIPGNYQVSASLAAAFAASQSGKTFFSVDSGKPSVRLQGRMANVAGEAFAAAEPGETVDVHIAALAYDAQGNLVGVRQTKSRVTLEEGKGVVFNLNVYSTGAAIASVVVKAEALLAGK